MKYQFSLGQSEIVLIFKTFQRNFPRILVKTKFTPMKTNFFIALCVAILLSSCDGEYEYAFPSVSFCFVDSEGNDQLGEALNSITDRNESFDEAIEFYIFEDEKDITDYKHIKKQNEIGLRFYIDEDKHFLSTGFQTSFPGPDKTIIIIKFQELFKDNEFHKIVTYWNTSKKHNKENLYPKCSHVEIDGKEAEIINHTENYVKIVLDK